MSTADAGYTGARRLASLTERENEILACLAQGMTNLEIGEALHLAVTTVKWYTRQIYNKLGVNSRREAAIFAQDNGLFSVSITHTPDIKHNLPADTTPFVGRHHEIESISGLIKNQNHRLITILAPGGMGKSRLAIQAARQQLDNFADGVFFVPLQPLSAPDQIVIAIGDSIGFVFLPDARTPERQLLDFLADKVMLLVLDNYEHLLAGTHHITDILLHASAVRILVTSREKLNLTSETIIHLQGLTYDRDGAQSDAADLFVDTVKRLTPSYKDSSDHQAIIDHICQLTEGMPLALLLAAAWSDTLTLAQIAGEIERSIGFLEQEKSDLPQRHRGIRAVFEPTWERLTESEQLMLAKFSIFAGGCTYDAAQQITGATPSILQSLVNKALIIHSTEGRYEMHELLRQYAEEKLHLLYDNEKTEQLHAEYYSQAVTDYDKGDYGRGNHDLIAPELDNIRKMWSQLVQTQQWDRIKSCCFGMRWIYEFFALYHEAVQWYEAAIKGLEEAGLLQHRRDVYGCLLAGYAFCLGDSGHPNSLSVCELALDTLYACELDAMTAYALAVAHVRYINLPVQNDRPRRQWIPLFEKVYSVSEQAGDYTTMGSALILRAIDELEVNGDVNTFNDLAHRALTIATAHEDYGTAGWAYGLLSSGYFHNCQYENALDTRIEQVRMQTEVGYKNWVNDSMSAVGWYALILGQYDIAFDYVKQAIEHDRKYYLPHNEVQHLMQLCEMYLYMGESNTCLDTMAEVERKLSKLSQHWQYDILVLQKQYAQAMIDQYLGHHDAVEKQCSSILGNPKTLSTHWGIHYRPLFERVLGESLIAQDCPEEAFSNLISALKNMDAHHTSQKLHTLVKLALACEPELETQILFMCSEHPGTFHAHREEALQRLSQLATTMNIDAFETGSKLGRHRSLDDTIALIIS